MSKKLKPCPFCGSKAEKDTKDYARLNDKKIILSIFCSNGDCGCVFYPDNFSNKSIVSEWNKRSKNAKE